MGTDRKSRRCHLLHQSGRIGQVDFEEDAFDFAFVELSKDQIEQLSGSVFVTGDNIERTDSPLPREAYRAVGFIAKDDHAHKHGDRSVTRGTTLAAIPAQKAAYEKRGVAESSHLLLSLDRTKTYFGGAMTSTPKLYGMSGSGVWRTRAGGMDELVAVMTEHHQKEGRFIVATRMGHILAAIAQYINGDLQVERPNTKT